MKKLWCLLIVLGLFAGDVCASIGYYGDASEFLTWLRLEMPKLQADMDYLDSDEALAPLVNAFIAQDKHDEAAMRNYLNELVQRIEGAIAEEENIDNEKIKNGKIHESRVQEITERWQKHKKRWQEFKPELADASPYNTLRMVEEFFTYQTFCWYNRNSYPCAPILLSPHTFLQVQDEVNAKDKSNVCKDVTTFYPLCKSKEYDWKETSEELELALNYAREPLKYYKEIRYKSPEYKPQPQEKIVKAKPPAGEWSIPEALMFMEDNPQKAYQALSKAESLGDKVELALFLYTYFPKKTKQIKDLLREAVSRLDDGNEYIGFSRHRGKEDFMETYAADLADDDKPVSVEYISEIMESISDKHLTDTQSFHLPCGIAKKRPEFIEITRGYYYSTMDNFIPHLKCYYDYDYKNFPHIDLDKYVTLTTKADGNFLGSHGGTMRYGHYAEENYIKAKAFLGMEDEKQNEYNLKYPYEVWSYFSYENRQTFLEIKEEYLRVKKVFEDYYTKQRKFSKQKAQKLTENLLFDLPYGTRWGVGWSEYLDRIPQNLRTFMIEERDIKEIEKYIKSADFAEKQKDQINDKYHIKTPMIHVAVQKPEYLRLLLELTKDMDSDKQKELDLEADINARNNINKTPLMLAAQYNFLESAKILLEKGADVNAVTHVEYRELKHDNRTALMYAAQSADLAFIKLLLENGADKEMRDTRGYRAVDYLMGFAALDYNSKMPEEDFKQAFELLW